MMYRHLPYVTLLIILLSACSHEQPKADMPKIEMPKAEMPKAIVEVPAPSPVAAPKAVIVPPPEVAVLVSSDIPAYRQVAEDISTRLGPRASTWYLHPSPDENAKVLADIARSQRSQIVAIGLDAAIDAKKLEDKQVVFCQVFNYEDHRLTSATHKGVGMLPSFEKSFAAWKAISPGLSEVAIITGPGLDEYVRKAEKAAKANGISLIHREVNSDMELLLEYKSIADKVQGYWLWPDNRVLSNAVIREVLTFSMRNGKQVAVFNDELLDLGGMISITSDYKDIATNVIERLERAQGKKAIPGPVIEPLDVAKLRINGLMVQRFGLTVPDRYRKYLDAP